MLVDCGKVSGDPRPYRAGPYGYPPGEALTLFRAVRGNVKFRNYPRSQTQDRLEFQREISHTNQESKSHVELKLDELTIMDSDHCLDWPPDKDGLFVTMTYSRGSPQLFMQRARPPVDVVPFHASQAIRLLESQPRDS
jgi:hypothetical protein